MANDELDRLRAALAHAHDEGSPAGGFLKKLAEMLRGRIQKKAVVQRLETPDRKKEAA